VAIIAILAGVVILAVNPAKQLANTRNAQRQENVTTILDAVYQYEIDNKGALPSTSGNPITTTLQEVCVSSSTGSNPTCPSGDVDLSNLTTNGTYLVAIPTDPSSGGTCTYSGTNYSGSTATVTGYLIEETSTTTPRITVVAPCAEQGATITVTR
jgi:type IV pilus assembly protein PilA